MDDVCLDAVSISFGSRRVLRTVSLIVAPGERLALIGPSGCGKSTILRLILGLLVAESGRVHVGPIEVTPASSRGVRRKVGYVSQDGGLFPHLTATDNVCLVARLDGWPEDKRVARLKELAELTRLPEHLLDRWPTQLSGGERQRVGLMRALMLDPDVLLLDEPLGALDPIVRARLQEDLRAVFGAFRKSVILVTHDMEEAAYLTDTIAVVHEGSILQRGTMTELLAAPAHPFVRELLETRRARVPSLA